MFCPCEILLVILHAVIHCVISDLLPISFLHLSSPNDTVLIFSIHRIYSSFNLSFFFPLLILAILQFSDFLTFFSSSDVQSRHCAVIITVHLELTLDQANSKVD